jgi:hypothetical protein
VALMAGALLVVLQYNLSTALPYYNWDLIAYMGVVNTQVEQTPEAAHAVTFAELRERLPPAHYNGLTGQNTRAPGFPAFKSAISTNPDYFAQQLPFYSVKPLYPMLMYLLSRLGMDLVTASVFISKAAYLLLGAVLFYWLLKYYPPLGSLVISALLMSLPFVVALARFSTPDALSALVVFMALLLFIESSYTKTAHALLVTSVAIRPDNMMFVLLLMGYSFVARKETRAMSAAVGLAAFILYQAQVIYSGNYGWSTLFHHSFVGRLVAPADQEVVVSFSQYLKILINQSRAPAIALGSYSLTLFILLSLLVLKLLFKPLYLLDRKFQTVSATLVFMCAHWLVFPSQKERVLAGMFLFVLLMLTIAIQERLNAERKGATTSLRS